MVPAASMGRARHRLGTVAGTAKQSTKRNQILLMPLGDQGIDTGGAAGGNETGWGADEQSEGGHTAAWTMAYFGCDELNFDLAISSFPSSGSTLISVNTSCPPSETTRTKK